MSANPLTSTRPRGSSPDRPPSRRRRVFRATPYLLIGIAVLMELLVHIFPMIAGMLTSLFQLNQYHIREWLEAPFVGLENFRVALDFNSSIGAGMLHSFGITILYAVLVVGISWAFGFAAAVALQNAFKGRGLLRTVFLIPYAMPVFAGVIVWSFMFQRDSGLVNHLLVDVLHVYDDPQFWLLGDKAFGAMVVVDVWRTWPFAFLTLMAGMQSIPDELYEASALDGADQWKQMRHITLRMLRPVNTVLILMLFLWSFNDFNTPFVLFGPTPPESADLITIHIYGASFSNWNFGLGSAMSVLMLIFLLIVTAVWFAWNRRGERDE
ncbi:carbohydrate ABC transporter permease [Microbacterium tumbae]